MPEGFHPTYSSSVGVMARLEKPLLDEYGRPRPNTATTTYKASYGLHQFSPSHEFLSESSSSSSTSASASRKSTPLNSRGAQNGGANNDAKNNVVGSDVVANQNSENAIGGGNNSEVMFMEDATDIGAGGSDNDSVVSSFSCIGALANGASAPHAYTMQDRNRHYKNGGGGGGNNNNSMTSTDGNRNVSFGDKNSYVSTRGDESHAGENDSQSSSSSLFSPSFGMKSSVHRDFFSGPRASTNGSNTRRDGRGLAHSHASTDARFHAEKFYQVCFHKNVFF
jgi:hypothetical protein